MKVYTIGFTQKTARQFFELIRKHQIQIVVDVRVSNSSQLAGFAKEKDLEYFLAEICSCGYVHDLDYAPTPKIMDDYKGKLISRGEFEKQYTDLILERDVGGFPEKYGDYERICLLCSEASARDCHRRLLAETLKAGFHDIEIEHL